VSLGRELNPPYMKLVATSTISNLVQYFCSNQKIKTFVHEDLHVFMHAAGKEIRLLV